MNNSSSGGIGFVGLLTIVFIVLKLTSVIDWSWWWVLSPLFICWSIIIALAVIVAIPLLSLKIQKRKLFKNKKKEKE